MNAITVKDLTVRFGETVALYNVSVAFGKSEARRS